MVQTSQMCHRQALKKNIPSSHPHISQLWKYYKPECYLQKHSSLLVQLSIKPETYTALKNIYTILPQHSFITCISLTSCKLKDRVTNMHVKKVVFLKSSNSVYIYLQDELFRCWSRSVCSSPNSLSIFCFLPCNIRILLKSCAFSSDRCSDMEEFLLCEISLVSERLSACLLLSGTDCV